MPRSFQAISLSIIEALPSLKSETINSWSFLGSAVARSIGQRRLEITLNPLLPTIWVKPSSMLLSRTCRAAAGSSGRILDGKPKFNA